MTGDKTAEAECREYLGSSYFEALSAEVEGLDDDINRDAVYRIIRERARELRGWKIVEPAGGRKVVKALDAVRTAIDGLKDALRVSQWVKGDSVEDFVDGRGPNARDVKRVKFKLFDKRSSLVDLAKLLGVMPGKNEHSGPNGRPIPVVTEIRRVIVYPKGRGSSGLSEELCERHKALKPSASAGPREG